MDDLLESFFLRLINCEKDYAYIDFITNIYGNKSLIIVKIKKAFLVALREPYNFKTLDKINSESGLEDDVPNALFIRYYESDN